MLSRNVRSTARLDWPRVFSALTRTQDAGAGVRRATAPRDGGLDQFYTKPATAAACLDDLRRLLEELGLPGELLFVEPSAGAGAFFHQLPRDRRIGLDIAPGHDDVMSCDFFTWTQALPVGRESVVIVGNPPFGKRGRTALRFFLRAAAFADTIAFIVPLNFRKYPIHRQLPFGFRWIFRRPLPHNSFCLADGSDYRVNTEFQVWTRHQSPHPNQRLYQPAPIRHPDFAMWQYNNTREALKVFSHDFDFAVPCQGWQDYSRRETDAAACEKHKQWILFKPMTRVARRRLFAEINYGELARRAATSVPGFRKCDLVLEYSSRFDGDPSDLLLKP